MKMYDCNTTADCEGFIRRDNVNLTDVFGSVQCYAQLKNSSSAAGMCDCTSAYATEGPACMTTSSATVGSAVLVFIGLLASVVVILRFLPTLVKIVYFRCWHLNAAGTTLVFAWISLLFAFMEFLLVSVRMFYPDERAVIADDICQSISLVFLTCAVLNCVITFVEMGSTVRVIQNVGRYRIPLIVTVIMLAVSIFLTLFLAPKTMASAALGFVIVLMLAIAGILGSMFLYDSTLRSLAKTSGRASKVSRSEVSMAMLHDVLFLGSDRMRQILGMTTASDNSKEESQDHSKNSQPHRSTSRKILHKSVSKTGADIQNELKKTASDLQSVVGGKTSGRQATKRDVKMIVFLMRTIRLGVWLFISLIVFFIGSAFSIIAFEIHDTNKSFRLVSLAHMIEAVSFSSALYQILLYLNAGYVKRIERNGKELHPSSSRKSENSKGSKDASKDISKTASKYVLTTPHGSIVVQNEEGDLN